MLLYNQFVAWCYKVSSLAPLSDYANYAVFQEFSTLSNYFLFANEKKFINVRCEKGYRNKIEKLNRDDTNLAITIKIKTAAANKMRLPITEYYQSKYLY